MDGSVHKSSLYLLRNREIGLAQSPYRLTCRMLRVLFESPNRKYGRRVWQQPKLKYSTAPWFVEEACRLLVNSRQTCLTTLMPKKPLFDVDTFISRSSIVYDVLFCQSCLESVECLRNSVGDGHLKNNSFFIFLFKLGFLELRSPDNGELILRIFLSNSPLAKMNELNWNVPHESFAISSVTQPRRLHGTNQQDVVLSLMIFKVYPLKVEAHFQVKRSCFGQDVVSAEVHSDLLLVMHSSKCNIRLYSMKHILQSPCYSVVRRLQVGERDSVTSLVVGTHPDGIPVNVEIKTRPPVLHEISSHGHHLELAVVGIEKGAISLLSLVSPPKSPYQFQILNSENKNILKNGTFQDDDKSSIMPHRLFTHPDDSSRLIYVSGSKVTVYRFSKSRSSLEVHFTCETRQSSTSRTSACSKGVSFRGRKLSPRKLYGSPNTSSELDDDDDMTTVVSISYSSELELLALLVTPQDRVAFFDNFNGRHVKTVYLQKPCLPTNYSSEEEQYVGMTFDTIVHCRRELERHSARWTCAIFSNVFSEKLAAIS